MSRQSWEPASFVETLTGVTTKTNVGDLNSSNNKILLLAVVSNPTAAAATVTVQDQGTLNFTISVPANSTTPSFPGYPGIQYTGQLSVTPSVAGLITLIGIN